MFFGSVSIGNIIPYTQLDTHEEGTGIESPGVYAGFRSLSRREIVLRKRIDIAHTQ
jgi:hypothetical protein